MVTQNRSRFSVNNIQGQASEIGTDFAPDIIISEQKSNVLGGKKNRASKSKRVLRREANKLKRLAKRKEGKGFMQKIWKSAKRYNPLSSTARAGTMGAIRINLFGMATRLYPAFLTDAEITKRKFNKANAQKVKANWAKIADFWEKKLGGKKSNLEKAIRSGYDKPIFRKNKKRNFLGADGKVFISHPQGIWRDTDPLSEARTNDVWEGMGWQYSDALFEQFIGADGKPDINLAKQNLSNDELLVISEAFAEEKSGVAGGDDAVVGTVITASMPVILKIISMIGGDKNPYDKGTSEGAEYTEDLNEATKEGDMVEPPLDQAELDKIEKEGQEDAKQGGEDEEKADTILGMPRMAVIIGGGILGAGLLGTLFYLLTRKSKK